MRFYKDNLHTLCRDITLFQDYLVSLRPWDNLDKAAKIFYPKELRLDSYWIILMPIKKSIIPSIHSCLHGFSPNNFLIMLASNDE